MTATVASLTRYPLKGFSGEDLPAIAVEPDAVIPGDRMLAFTHGASAYDPAAPGWHPKFNFLHLARHEVLATVAVAVDPDARRLRLTRGDAVLVEDAFDTADGRAAIEAAVNDLAGEAAPPPFTLIEPPGFAMTDMAPPYLSFINRATVRDIGHMVGVDIDPVRFRGNVLIDGLAPWVERDWVGRTLTIGDVTLVVEHGIDRCAAVNVNPATALRDMNIPQTLQRRLNHLECGIYARVTGAGTLTAGDAIAVA